MIPVPRSFQRDRVDLHLREWPGERRPIVLLHGAAVDGSMWDAQAAALAAAGHRVIVPDLRGHGASRPTAGPLTKDQLIADLMFMLDVLEIHSPVIAGLSLGGSLGQAAVQAHPARAAGLAVFDATWRAGPLRSWERAALRMAAPILQLIPARSLPRVAARASAVTADGIRRATKAFARLTKAEFIAAWSAAPQFVAPNPQQRTPVPLLLVRGECDDVGNIATAMTAWAAAEDVPLVIIPGAGHISTWDAPEDTARVLIEFMEQIEERIDA